jgi:hypothetical protein
MGKRSTFPRIERDHYPTPYKAVTYLAPHLGDVRFFAEPCAGKGDLVRHLESFGKICQYASDIEYGQNAFDRDEYGSIDAIITNPPFTRKLLHGLIWHFVRIAPTWLLIEWDWAATKQARPFLPMCSTIAVIGRLKWFPDTPHVGKDNYAWYRFDESHTSGPRAINVETADEKIRVLERARPARHGSAPALVDSPRPQ